MNTVCGQLTTLGALAPPAPSPSYPGDDSDFGSSSYVGRTATAVDEAVRTLSTLRRSASRRPTGSPPTASAS